MVLKTRGLGTGATFMRGSIDNYYSERGLENASNFYGRAVYYPNYGTRPPAAAQWAGSTSSTSQLEYAGCYSSIVAAFIANRLSAIVCYCNEEHG